MTEVIACRARQLTVYTWYCDCGRCVERRAWAKKRMKARVPIRRTPTQEALRVIDEWVRLDWNSDAVASVTGVSTNTCAYWLKMRRYPKPIRLGPLTTEVIVAARAKRATAGQVGATVAIRQLQALGWMKWSCDELARRSDGVLNLNTLETNRRGASSRGVPIRRLAATKAAAIDALYNDLSNRVGVTYEARMSAVAHGWLPPAAWDDITDLDEVPGSEVVDLPVDMVAVERRLAGQRNPDGTIIHLTMVERRQVLAIGILRGLTLGYIDKVCGVNAYQAHIRYRFRWATPETTRLYAVFTTGWSYHHELLEAC